MWQRDFADMTELRTLRWGDYARLSRWSQCNHKDPRKREAGGRGQCDNKRETETGIGRSYTVDFKAE